MKSDAAGIIVIDGTRFGISVIRGGRSLWRYSVKNLLVPGAWIILSSSSRSRIYTQRTRPGIQEIRIFHATRYSLFSIFQQIYWNISEKNAIGAIGQILAENFRRHSDCFKDARDFALANFFQSKFSTLHANCVCLSTSMINNNIFLFVMKKLSN